MENRLAWDNTIYKLYAYLLFPSKTLHSNTLCILRHRTGSKVTLITFDPRGGRSPQEGISVNSEKICVFQQKSVKETFQTFLFLLINSKNIECKSWFPQVKPLYETVLKSKTQIAIIDTEMFQLYLHDFIGEKNIPLQTGGVL